MRCNADTLAGAGVAFWGPQRTRTGLFRGILPDPTLPARSLPVQRARGRVLLNLDRMQRQGHEMLIVSEENMSGTVRENLRIGALYIGAGRRIAQYCAAFDGRITRIVLTIRSLDRYWMSALGFGLTRGKTPPDLATLNRLAYGERGWRDVITDIARAVPGATLRVIPFEEPGGRPDALLTAMSGREAPLRHNGIHLNATPDLPTLRGIATGAGLPPGDGPWQPFDHWQRVALRDKYQEDLNWLASGADGLAEPVCLPRTIRAGPTPPDRDVTRGRSHDSQQRRMAQDR